MNLVFGLSRQIANNDVKSCLQFVEFRGFLLEIHSSHVYNAADIA